MNQLSTNKKRRGFPLFIKYLIVCIIAIVLITGGIRWIINVDSRQEVGIEINNLYEIAEIQIAAQYNNIIGDALSVKAITRSYIDRQGNVAGSDKAELIRLYTDIIENTKKYAAIKYIRPDGTEVFAGQPKETIISDFLVEKYEGEVPDAVLYAYISEFNHSERVKEVTFTVTIPMQDENDEFCGYILMEPYLAVIIKDVERALENANLHYELLNIVENDATYVYSDMDRARGTNSLLMSTVHGAEIASELANSTEPNGNFESVDGVSYYQKFDMPVSNYYGDNHYYESPGSYVYILTLPKAYYEEITNMDPNWFIALAGAVGVLSLLVTILLFIAQSNRRKFAAKTTKMAQVDTLTGLLNRAYFTELFENMVEDDPEAKYSILFMDLDGFKDINDSYGHNMGDKVLRVVANRLVMAARREDLVSRFGGDEFAMLINYSSVDQIRYVANKVVRAIDEVMVIDDNEYHVGVSVGVAIYPDHARTVDDLYKVADNAMYKVKYSTKNAYYISKGDDKVL